MNRTRSAVLAAVLLGGLVAVGGSAVAHETMLAVGVDVDPTQPAAGENATVDVTVDSLDPEGDAVRVTEVRLYEGPGEDADQLDSVDPDAWVGAGGSGNWTLYAELDSAGEYDMRAEIELLSQDQSSRTITRTVPVRVVDPHPSLALSADPVGAAGETDLSLSVANAANGTITGLEVAASSDAVTLTEPRKLQSSLAAGEATTLTFPATDVEAGSLTLEADVAYTAADGERRTFTRTLETTVGTVENPGRIELTGVRVEQQGRTLSVRGSASNPGSTNATGVQIRAVGGDRVAPASSRASFFVGDVRAGDYASFQVHSRLTAAENGTVDVPVRVEYGVDGERVVRNVTLSATVNSGGAAPPANRSGGLPVVPIAVVGVVVAAGWAWRRRG